MTQEEDTTHSSPNEYDELVLSKLARAIGRPKAEALLREVMSDLGITSLQSPQDIYYCGEALMKYRGFREVVGRSLKVFALLRGAVAPGEEAEEAGAEA